MKKLTYFILATLIIGSCKPKFDPSDDFREVDVMYAVLNPDAPKQYIQVSRGFQTNGENATDVAKDENSIFHQDSMIVELIEYLPSGTEVTRTKLKKEQINDRDEGIFANPNHYLYTLDSNDYKVKDGTDYKLKITNSVSLKSSFSNLTTLIDYEFENYLGGVDVNIVKKDSVKDQPVYIKNFNGENVVYAVDFIIPYVTKDKDNNVVARDSMILGITSQKNAETGNLSELFISGDKFVNAFLNEVEPLPVDSDMKRELDIPYLQASCYGPNLVEYILAEESFNALSQTKPFYSNVYDTETNEKQAGVVSSVKTIRQVVFIALPSIQYISSINPQLGFQQ